MTDTKIDVPPLTRADRHWYGLGQFAEGMKNEGFSLLLLFFYTQVTGLSGSLAGLALLIALLFDAVTDPLVGVLSDRTKSRMGRRHPWIFASIIPLIVTYYFTFNPPAGLGQGGLFAWLLTFVVLTRAAMTLFHVPHLSLGAELSTVYEERTAIVTTRMLYSRIGGAVGTVAAFGIFMAPTEAFPIGQLNPAAYPGYAVFAVVMMGVTLLASAWFTLRRVPYLVKAEEAQTDAHPFRAMYQGLLDGMRRQSFRSLFLGNLLSFVAWGTAGALGIALGTYFWRGDAQDLMIWGICAGAGVFVGLGFWQRYAATHDKRTTFMRGLLVFLLFTAPPPVLKLVGFWPEWGTPLYMPAFWLFVGFCAHFGIAATMVTGGSMMADVIDEDELETGRRREGIYFGTISFVAKAAAGVGSLIAGVTIELSGLTPEMTPQSVPPETEQALGLALAFVMVFLVGGSVGLFSKYNLSREKLADIQSQLNARAAAAE